MAFIEYALPCSGTILEGILLWRLSSQRLWRTYPFLTIFLLCVLLRDVSLFAVTWFRPDWFARFFWRTETISVFCRFLVNWEFIRSVFPKDSKLQAVAWKCLFAVEVFVLPCIVLLTWGQVSSALYVRRFPLFEQYLSLCQAVLLLVPAFVASYYRLEIGRRMRGVGLGFGIYASLCAANFAGLSASLGFFSVGRFLPPIISVLMFVIWLWAFCQEEEAESETRIMARHLSEQTPWFGTKA